MKQISLVLLIWAAAVQANAQVVKDKDAFADAFVRIFSQRVNGFDSLAQVLDQPGVNHAAILPGATDCYVSSNYVFGAAYDFADSSAGVAFFNEMKQLISYAATVNGVKAAFKPVDHDPELNQVFFLDAAGYTNNNCNIDFEVNHPDDRLYSSDDDEDDGSVRNKKQPKTTYTVRLLIGPGDQYCYYTSYGERVNDPEVTDFIQKIVFGKDTALVAIKTNRRIENENTVYDSKLNVTGFTTSIIEARGNKYTGYHVYLSKEYTTTESAFLEAVNDFMLKLKAALPNDYSFEPFPNDHYLSFQPVHYNHVPENVAEMVLEYSQVEDKKDTYNLKLHIVRTTKNK